jgi:hypothetical protein
MKFATLSDYIAIIGKLAEKGPLEASELQSLLAIEKVALEGALSFLVTQHVIKERIIGDASSGYIVTARGFKILRYFSKRVSEVRP